MVGGDGESGRPFLFTIPFFFFEVFSRTDRVNTGRPSDQTVTEPPAEQYNSIAHNSLDRMDVCCHKTKAIQLRQRQSTMTTRLSLPRILLLAILAVDEGAAFLPTHRRQNQPSFLSRTNADARSVIGGGRHRNLARLQAGRSPQDDDLRVEEYDDEDDDEDNHIDLAGKDWRAFRARLVMAEPSVVEEDVREHDQQRHVMSGSNNFEDHFQQEECDADSGECDLDNIGAAFGLAGNATSDHPSTASRPRARPQQQQRRQSGPNPITPQGLFQPNRTPTTNDGAFIGSADADSAFENKLQSMTPLDPSQWAFETGKMIEKGAVVLGSVEQEYGFGLRQQYFHKAAMLVLDHEVNTFTKGIILNRPTERYLDDDVNEGVKWRVWYGGDVQGIDSEKPDFVCLHSLTDKRVTDASVPVMDDMHWTTFENAKQLVHAGIAEPSDFWVFCGYAGWGPGQLTAELEHDSWYMVATDTETLLKELKRQSAGSDPRDAGLETWSLLMNMIGRGDIADDIVGEFDDLMLKEWAEQNLMSPDHAGKVLQQSSAPRSGPPRNLLHRDPSDRLDVLRAQAAEQIKPGTLVRASPFERSPFLLRDQELHKSVVLILEDDENVSIGAILNRPSAKGLDVNVAERDGRQAHKTHLPIRYGGQYSVKDSEPLMWLHNSPVLRNANVGTPVGSDRAGIWKCTPDEVSKAIGQGLGVPEEFLVVTGVTVWSKDGRFSEGIQGEVAKGKFELIPEDRTPAVWGALAFQDVLATTNLITSLEVADAAWCAGAPHSPQEVPGRMPHLNHPSNHMSSPHHHHNDPRRPQPNPIYPHQQPNLHGQMNMQAHPNPLHARPWDIEMDESPENDFSAYRQKEDQNLVFKSDVKVSHLANKALRSWVATFLLGAPTLGA